MSEPDETGPRATQEPPPAPSRTLSIDQYLELRGVLAHRRPARRALAGAVRSATVEVFDKLFARVDGEA